MATATKRRPTKKAPAKKVEPEVEELEVDDEVEEDEVEDDEDEDLEELEEDEVEEVAPKSKTKKKTGAQQEVTFGVSDLVQYLIKTTGKKVDARGLRNLIRRMARDGKGRVDREIVAGNRARYDWSGPKDPEVKAIIKAFNAGELDQDKKEKLDALKERNEKIRAEKAKQGVKATKKKKAKPAPVVEDDDDEDELELDDDE